ncbi:MAG: nucleotidyltransferase family protein [Desulfurivibrionaceae bacterium]
MQEQKNLASFWVVGIGLFGSFARDEQTSSSDIDILVEFAPEKHTFDNFMDVSFFLEELLGRKVKIVTPESLSPHIGPHIQKELERVTTANTYHILLKYIWCLPNWVQTSC